MSSLPRASFLITLLFAFSFLNAAEPEKKPAYPPTLSGGAPCGSCIAPENLSWKTVVAADKEPGEPLVLSGKVFQPDGKTPAEGMVLFVFQTDATGHYNDKGDPSHPRLKGWMKIGADGKYEFRTIKPGAYPHRSEPAHIHVHVYGPGYSEQSIEDYWFDGDPRIDKTALAKATGPEGHPFVVIISLKRDGDGVWRSTRDIKLKSVK